MNGQLLFWIGSINVLTWILRFLILGFLQPISLCLLMFSIQVRNVLTVMLPQMNGSYFLMRQQLRRLRRGGCHRTLFLLFHVLRFLLRILNICSSCRGCSYRSKRYRATVTTYPLIFPPNAREWLTKRLCCLPSIWGTKEKHRNLELYFFKKKRARLQGQNILWKIIRVHSIIYSIELIYIQFIL